METTTLIAALRRADAYPAPPAGDVTVLQTHISVLFFTDDRVYKVKKPVRLDFLDYTALARRRHFCEEEVRLNRRLAPDVYLGVVPITRDADGMVRVNGPGEAIEYAVEMVRLPADRMLSSRLDRGEIDNRHLDDLARLLADFHRDADAGPDVDAFARPAEVEALVRQTLDTLDAFVIGSAATLSRRLLDHLRAAAATWLGEHAALLDRRVREGRIREGHGDLHAGNICLADDAIRIYDRVEFSRRFRCRDVACELAFLAMDLDLRCYRGFAGYLLRRYAELTDDPELPAVAAFYKTHLAMVRGMVATLRAADAAVDADARRVARLEAMRYFHLAGAYTLPPSLILMCGLPGTGKSRAARAIARPFEATVLRSDVVRKELAGVAAHARGAAGFDDGIYAPEFTRRTYAALLGRAQEHLRRHETVIVDATFPTAELRHDFFAAADDLGITGVLAEMECPEEVVRLRLRDRARDADEASDADWRVHRHAAARFQPPDELPEAHRLRLDSRRPPEELIGAVIDLLIHRR